MKYFLRIIFIAVLFSACTNYYNDTIHWMDSIDENESIENVKKSQPKFVKIDWKDPRIVDSEVWFYIEDIEGHHDILNMTHILTFKENKFQGRRSHK